MAIQQSTLSTYHCISIPAAQDIVPAGTAFVKQGELKGLRTYKELNTGTIIREWEICSIITLNAGNQSKYFSPRSGCKIQSI